MEPIARPRAGCRGIIHPFPFFRWSRHGSLAGAFLLLTYTPLLAIPSPDLVINFFASAAQVLGLLTVVLGGFAVGFQKQSKIRGQAAGSSFRLPFWIALILFLCSAAANIFQWSRGIDERNRRLQTNLWRSSTEGGRKVGDKTLKTRSYGEQEKHLHGISTEQLASWLAEKKPLNIIDVREPEEMAMGRIEGAWGVRYPDLMIEAERDRSRIVQPGRETILLCESGNRSSEVCDELREKYGIESRFMAGGYEKWVAEALPLVDTRRRTSVDIRNIPDYPNKEVLFDTRQIERLIEAEKVVFVDVRYPGDFAPDHLPLRAISGVPDEEIPAAIKGRDFPKDLPVVVNIPIRRMPTELMLAALKALPSDRPIVAPCYDKRSSFYALILGSRLNELGYDYRGRYTVPHEFAVPVEEKAYVLQWKETQKGRTLLGMAARPLAALLGGLEGFTGSLAFAIFALVVLLRGLFLPFTVKADRDQLLQKWMAPEIKDLRKKFKEDPGRASRAVLSLHRRARLTPLRNLCGTMAQLLLFLVFFSVVNTTAAGSTEHLLWIPSLGESDPWYILPALVGILIFTHLWLGAGRRDFRTFSFHLLCGGALIALTFSLKSAVNFYLVCNVALLAFQSRSTRLFLERGRKREQALARLRAPGGGAVLASDPGVIPLRSAHRVHGAGNKAIRLAQMMEAGLPVPDGFVVTDRVLGRNSSGNGAQGLQATALERRRIERCWNRLAADKVAVRSSGLNEDGTDKSYAGIFESKLNVRREELFSALEEVQASMRSARASAYAGNSQERGGALVQMMIPADYAGVLFTEHPSSAGCMMVEMVAGLGESLVSGSATPETYAFGRLSGAPMLDSRKAPIDVSPLLRLALQVEKLFGCPQDIEWAYAGGRFFILQARDITVSIREGISPRAALEAERSRLLALAEGAPQDEPVFALNELSELMPRPTPLSLSFMEKLWAPGGSTDIACRSLGIAYRIEEDARPYVNSVFGALYINRTEEKKRLGRGPGALATFRLARSGENIEREFQEEFLPGFLRRMRILEALDLTTLKVTELVSYFHEWMERFITEDYVRAEVINIAADFYLKTAAGRLEKLGLDPAVYLAKMPETVVHKAMSILRAVAAGRRRTADFLEIFGHRAPQDYELSQARFYESPTLVQSMLARIREHSHSSKVAGMTPRDLEFWFVEETEGLPSDELPPDFPKNPLLVIAVKRARRFQVLKEEAKHQCLRELALLRSVLVEIDRRLDLGNGIFYLTLEEVSGLKEDREVLNQTLATIERRRMAAEQWKNIQLPSELSILQLESLDTEGEVTVAAAARPDGALAGKRVSGEGEVIGRVRVIHRPEEIESFREDEILVARFTDPTWTPLFPLASGVVTEIGGWLSHAAIVAREYGVTAIVGVTGALQALETGEIVRLCASGLIEKLGVDRRLHERFHINAPARIHLDEKKIIGVMNDLSRTGARLRIQGRLETGQDVRLVLGNGDAEVMAEVIRAGPNGEYGIRFGAEIPSDRFERIRLEHQDAYPGRKSRSRPGREAGAGPEPLN